MGGHATADDYDHAGAAAYSVALMTTDPTKKVYYFDEVIRHYIQKITLWGGQAIDYQWAGVASYKAGELTADPGTREQYFVEASRHYNQVVELLSDRATAIHYQRAGHVFFSSRSYDNKLYKEGILL